MPRVTTAADRLELDGQPVRRYTSAAGAPAPKTSAAASVFEQGRKAKAANAVQRAPIDFDSIQIHRGVPIPDPRAGTTGFADLLHRMQTGDMVKLTQRQTYSLKNQAKRENVRLAIRRLSAEEFGVWRLS